MLKRGIGGVYHSVSAKYLQTYCDEYALRYYRRSAKQPMFDALLSQVLVKAEQLPNQTGEVFAGDRVHS